MSKVTIMICDVCGRRIDSDEEYKTMTIFPRGGAVTRNRAGMRAPQRTVQVCAECFEKIGFQVEPAVTITREGKIGRVDK